MSSTTPSADGAGATVRLPAVLRGFECGRSTMCCRSPFGARFSPAEVARIRSSLRRAPGAASVEERFEAALVRPPHGSAALVRLRGRCPMLADPAPGEPNRCALLCAIGLSAMPEVCRSFPRSIVRTPGGVEVAFVLACPTAAREVVRHAAPFRWETLPETRWAYPPARRTGRRVCLDMLERIDFAALEQLRQSWWDTLERAAADAGETARALASLTRSPEAPGLAAVSSDLSWSGLPADIADRVVEALDRLPHRRPSSPEAGQERRAELRRPRSLGELAAAAGESSAALSSAAGLAVQRAGVHVGGTVLFGLRVAGFEAILAAVLLDALRRTGEHGVEAAADAASAAGQAVCEGLLAGACRAAE